MALTRDKKNQIYEDVSNILDTSKLTVVAKYTGTSVKQLQQLRKIAKESGTSVKVFKNRIVLKALEANPKFKDIDMSLFTGMLIYASNNQDEIASAKVITDFAKANPTLQIVGSLDLDGKLMSAIDTKELASIPTLEVLRGQLVGTLAAPLSGFVGVLTGNVRSILNVLNAHAEQVN
jgi:large subunit ribosomal protein L10